MRRALLAMALALWIGALGAGAAAAQSSGSLKCESWNYQPTRCPVPNLVDARLTSVMAGQCYQGRNWGFDRGAIWVNNGCRAKFSYQTAYANSGNSGGYPGGGYSGGNQGSTVIKCVSWDYKDTRCSVDTRGGVELSRQLAGNCTQGQTWGYDRGGIWVSNGCRAEFRVFYGGGGNTGGGGYYPPQNQGFKIKCQSFNYEAARCPASIRTGVRLVKVIGGECKFNRTWSWDRGGIWVNNGCRAEFMVDG
ncbi:MAG: DUF3011 domain-containing protein [Polymorphobacter sp.]